MYPGSRIAVSFMENVKKWFLPIAQKHRLSQGRERMNCPCSGCKNLLLEPDNVVLSYLVWHGFIKNYFVWKFHGEEDTSSTDGG